MNLWGIALWAAFGVLCYLLGRLHGAVKPKRNSWDLVVTPRYETRVMEPVEQPEDTRPQWEIDMDETANRAWRNAW